LRFGFCISSTPLRQQQRERGAAAGRGLHFDLAVVHLDDPVDHRQPDPGSMILRREVEVKDTVEVLGRIPTPCPRPELDPVSERGAVKPQRPGSACLAGVDRQVEDRWRSIAASPLTPADLGGLDRVRTLCCAPRA
jgi:hypothetical protein